MTKIECTETMCFHNNDGLCGKDLIVMDVEAGTYQQFSERSKNNYENRYFHHHVFNSLLVVKLIDYMNLQIKDIEAIIPMHIIIIVQKLSNGEIPDNKAIFEFINSSKYKSPFPSDNI